MKIKISKIELYIFIGFGILLFIIPYLFTRSWGIFPIDDVGGTVGGVTAPFLGFFGSILVYFALKSQIEANKLVQNQIYKQEIDSKIEKRSDYFNNKVSIIQYELNNFNYAFNDKTRATSPKYNYLGSQAIQKLLENSKDSYFGKKEKTPYELEPKLVELRSLLVFLELTLIEIRNDSIIDSEIKDDILIVLKYILNSKIIANFQSLEEFKSKHNSACPHGCGNYHGIPADLFDTVDRIHSLIYMKL